MGTEWIKLTDCCDDDDGIGLDQNAARNLQGNLESLPSCAIDSIAECLHFETAVANEHVAFPEVWLNTYTATPSEAATSRRTGTSTLAVSVAKKVTLAEYLTKTTS